MTRSLQKVFAALGLALFVMLEGALLLAGLVGATTTSDDAEAKLPGLLLWLMSVPSWITLGLFPLVIVALAIWVFRGDRSLERSLIASNKDYKATNDRAWEFQAQYTELVDRVGTLSERVEDLASRLPSSEAVFSEIGERIASLEYKYSRLPITEHKGAENLVQLYVEMGLKTYMGELDVLKSDLAEALKQIEADIAKAREFNRESGSGTQ